MKNKLKIIATATIALALCACKSTPSPVQEMTPYEKVMAASNKRTKDILVKAALLAAKAQAVRARTEQALHQPMLSSDQIRQARFQNEYVPVGMDKKIQLSWAAAPEPVIQRVASTAGYELKFKNQRNPIPEDVYLDSTLRSLKEIIDSVEIQSRGYIDRIDIVDDHDRKVITVVYTKF